MLNEDLRKGLTPKNDPDYFIAIYDISQDNDCNQDSIKFTFHQINKNLFEIEEDSIVTEKTLSISSNLEMDDLGLYKTKLVGYEFKKGERLVDCKKCTYCIENESHVKSCSQERTNFSLTKKIKCSVYSPTAENDISSHYIEMIQIPLSKRIEIDFTQPYTDIPSIIVNIDKEYELLYRSYSCEYIKNSDDKYIGVSIIFNNLKTRSNYPDIKITIIGDSKPIITENDETVEEEEEENGSNTDTSSNETG